MCFHSFACTLPAKARGNVVNVIAMSSASRIKLHFDTIRLFSVNLHWFVIQPNPSIASILFAFVTTVNFIAIFQVLATS